MTLLIGLIAVIFLLAGLLVEQALTSHRYKTALAALRVRADNAYAVMRDEIAGLRLADRLRLDAEHALAEGGDILLRIRRDDLYAAAVTIVGDLEREAQSAQWKWHQAFGRLIALYPTAGHAITHAIEAAHLALPMKES